MAISQETRRALKQRAGGRCECTMSLCSHHRAGQQCTHQLRTWEAHHKWAGGPDTLSNLIAMCVTCHKNTRTYGRH